MWISSFGIIVEVTNLIIYNLRSTKLLMSSKSFDAALTFKKAAKRYIYSRVVHFIKSLCLLSSLLTKFFPMAR